jgi:hypothetical protein
MAPAAAGTTDVPVAVGVTAAAGAAAVMPADTAAAAVVTAADAAQAQQESSSIPAEATGDSMLTPVSGLQLTPAACSVTAVRRRVRRRAGDQEAPAAAAAGGAGDVSPEAHQHELQERQQQGNTDDAIMDVVMDSPPVPEQQGLPANRQQRVHSPPEPTDQRNTRRQRLAAPAEATAPRPSSSSSRQGPAFRGRLTRLQSSCCSSLTMLASSSCSHTPVTARVQRSREQMRLRSFTTLQVSRAAASQCSRSH